jgi:hypothetical protein
MVRETASAPKWMNQEGTRPYRQLGQEACSSHFHGKSRAAFEFGALARRTSARSKTSVSVRNGFAFLQRISWNAYNEAKNLIPQAKTHKQEQGCYPNRIYVNWIYINTKRHDLCNNQYIMDDYSKTSIDDA